MSQVRQSLAESQSPSFPRRAAIAVNGSLSLYVLSLLLLAALYFAAGKFGLSLASVHTNVSPVWPPTGIALAAVLLLGYRVWPGIFLGALLTNLLTPVPVAGAFGIAFGNTLEALVAARVLSAIGFHLSLDRARDVFKFVVAATFCTALSATIGNLSLCLSGAASWSSFSSLWITWWLGDLTGAVTVTPLILVWNSGKNHWLPKQRYLEATVLIVLLSLSAIATFGGTPSQLHYYPLVRLMIPFLLWAAFRLGRRGVTVAIAVISAFAIWGTSHGSGPFVTGNPNEALMMLQLFIGSNAVTFLFLVAVVEELRHAETKRLQDQSRLEANLAVTRILAESPTLTDATSRILKTIGEKLEWEVGDMWTLNAEGKELRCLTVWHSPAAKVEKFEALTRQRTFAPGTGLPGRVWSGLKPAWIRDVTKDKNFLRAPVAAAEGLHGAFAFPIVFADQLLGVMEFFSREIREPDGALLEMFESIGKQIGLFMERKRAEESLVSAANALRENDERLRLATQTGKVGIWDWDIVANRVSWTDSLYSIHGVTEEQFDGTVEGFAELVHPDDRAAVSKAIDDSLNGAAPYQLEMRAVKPDGRVVWIFTNAIVLREQGNPVRMIGATLDISDLKRAEETLRHTAAIVESTDDAVIATDLNGVINSWNPAAERLYGYTSEEIVGRPVSVLMLEERRDEELAMLDRLKRGGRFHYETTRVAKDGRRIEVSLTISPIMDSTGRVIGASKIARDITEQKRAEVALRESQAQLENMIGAAMDAVITIDRDQRIMIFNTAAEVMFGCLSSDVIGKPIDIFIPESLRAVHRQHVSAFGEAGVTKRSMGALGALSGVRANGEEFPIEASISQIEVKGQRLYTVILRDITERRRAEAERERLLAAERAAREDAEVASRTKDEFLATLSHELRTPLTAMLGWLTILREHKLDKKTTEHAIETIERNAKTQAQLIEDLVDISRIVGGKLNLEVMPTELLPVINAAVDVVQPAANAKEITIDVNYDATVGPVAGDAARLQQVIWNLLSNAVKFTPKGGTVSIDFKRHNGFAEVIVRDTGIGISADFLPHVFERFRQAESAATRSHRGMGLGLAIVRHLVELHGGTVSAATNGENKGSTFTVHLPLAVEKKRPVVLAHKSNGDDSFALKGLRILLVEDEPDARELIAMVLQSSGAQVEAVDSAKCALQSLSQFAPDVLVSDIGLPLESGYDLIRKVRALTSDIKTVPAIALTAFATENDRKLSMSAGFQAHLAKPVEPTDLLEAIKFVVNGKH